MSPRTKRLLLGLLGGLVLLTATEVIGRTGALGQAWPAPTEAIGTVLGRESTRNLLLRSLGATLSAAGTGLLLGSLAGMLLGLTGFLVPALRAGLDQLASILNTVPLVALAPLLIALVGANGMSSLTAALGAGFAMFVATATGFVAVSAAHSDYFRVAGASRIQHIVRLSIPSAIPSLLDGLTLAASGAVLGAVLGEWFGAPRGLGVLMISSMQNFQIDLLFISALTCALVSLLAFYVMAALQRVIGRNFA
ncbi:MAG: nitrate/sulfonate/bicarbonate transporter, inner rane subunit [Pseudarthrobacter sp.]|nr:nitrate/sulfonate/bicarbonate transporter, inner rane subunit [Pseudarthrobacter sp.]